MQKYTGLLTGFDCCSAMYQHLPGHKNRVKYEYSDQNRPEIHIKKIAISGQTEREDRNKKTLRCVDSSIINISK